MEEQKEEIDFRKNQNNNWLLRNRELIALAVILVLMAIASIATLAVLGLIVSPLLVIPCLLLFTAALVGIKILYNEHKLNISKGNRGSELEPDDITSNVEPTFPVIM